MENKTLCIECGGEKKQYSHEGRATFLKRRFCSLSCATTWRHKNMPFSLFIKGHKVRVGVKHPDSFIQARKGKGNPSWKGDACGSHSLHSWIADNFSTPDFCELCNEPVEGKACDWSNKDHKYTRKREDWQYAHRGCHMKYDYKMGLRSKAKGSPRHQEVDKR